MLLRALTVLTTLAMPALAAPIVPHPEFPAYFSINGQPMLLIGGSDEDNVFQLPHLEAHLRTLAAAGGNYVRCSMSARDPGDIWPFHRDPATGLYDLTRPEGGFWDRFARLLELSAELGIVVQIEVWDRFDYVRAPWQDNPYNPKNNINYTPAQSGLATAYDAHPNALESPFFRTPPALEDNALLRQHQHTFLDKLLSLTLPHDHILYCISNETKESPEWGRYWANAIHSAAAQAGKTVLVTEMWDARDLADDQHRATWEHPETYGFIDISQVNHQVHQTHWDQLLAFRTTLAATGIPRPLTTVKIYGANSGYYGTTRDGIERFWRNIIAGLAATRFHRPGSGLGLTPIAQTHLRAARALANRVPLHRYDPAAAHLHNRSANEAYGTGHPDLGFAVFFPDGGNVLLSSTTPLPNAPVRLHWLDIRTATWIDPVEASFDAENNLRLITPSEEGYWAVIIDRLPPP